MCKKLKLISLFSGIGAFEKALKNIGVDYELINYCEIDKHASKSYSVLHGVDENKNLWDIRNVDIEKLPKDIDLITHGSPCQDFSIAGKMNGGDKGSKTRSSLMWDSVGIIKKCKPKYVIWENVKNVLSSKLKHNFNNYIKELENIGYVNYYKVLNAKDFGIPQNRERIFVVSILGGDDEFEFPTGEPLKINLFELLDEYVDGKYYISIDRFVQHNIKNIELIEEKRVGDFRYDDGFRIRKNNIFPTITCRVGSSSLSIPLIFNKRIFDGYMSNVKTKLNETGIGYNPCNREYAGLKEISPTLCARDYKDPKIVKFLNQGLTIRKLTPKECWRLMGFDDNDIDICIDNGISNTQLYKQAGNSIVVPILESIFKILLKKEIKI